MMQYRLCKSKKVIAVEPFEFYRKHMEKEKGYQTYAYATGVLNRMGTKSIDVIVSFDVIEHADDPIHFMEEIYDLLFVKQRIRWMIHCWGLSLKIPI